MILQRWLYRTTLLLWLLAAAAMPVALWMVFRYAPEEKIMGAAQRIFYFHVPAAVMTYAAVAFLLVGAIAYLWTRDLKWDNLARASTEVSLLFCTLVLITGPIWAKPAWGTWWTWEARLTTTLLLWLLLIGSLMVRGYAENRDLGARLASIVGIVAAIDIPIIHKAVEWWRGQHPQVFGPGKTDGLAAGMGETLMFCMGTFFVLMILLIAVRYSVASLEDRTDSAVERLSGR